MNQIMSASPQVFIHLPKTAGTFVRHVLEQLYRTVGTAYPTKPFTPLAEKSADDLRSLRRANVVIGHEDYHSVLSVFGQVPIYTILRNPVDRVISYYNHLMTHTAMFADRKLSLDRFLGRVEDIELDNLQVRYLSGNPMSEKPNESSLSKAIANVESGAIQVGVQELMNLTFQKLPIFCGAKPGDFPNKNQSSFGFSRASFTDGEITKLRASQALDFKLYQYCLDHLKSGAVAQPKSLPAQMWLTATTSGG